VAPQPRQKWALLATEGATWLADDLFWCNGDAGDSESKGPARPTQGEGRQGHGTMEIGGAALVFPMGKEQFVLHRTGLAE
jgi:hypothetical protein